MFTTLEEIREELLRLVEYLTPNQPNSLVGEFFYRLVYHEEDQLGATFRGIHFQPANSYYETELCWLMGGAPAGLMSIIVSVETKQGVRFPKSCQYSRHLWNVPDGYFSVNILSMRPCYICRHKIPFDVIVRQSRVVEFFAAIKTEYHII